MVSAEIRILRMLPDDATGMCSREICRSDPAHCCRPRLLATAGAWFLWDFSFYGNKVFQSTFIKVLSPSGAGQLPFTSLTADTCNSAIHSHLFLCMAQTFVYNTQRSNPTFAELLLVPSDLEETLLWTLLNSGVALIGYWLAAAVVDSPRVGRLRLQLLGFAADAILFYIAAAVYPSLTSKKGLPTFQFIYFFSSFWGQFGPNCTTFLLAGKLCPPVREWCIIDIKVTTHASMCCSSYLVQPCC